MKRKRREPLACPSAWTKGPGVSAGRNHRFTGACPTVVSCYLRKVDAARSIAGEVLKSPGNCGFFSNRPILDGRAGCRAFATAVVIPMSELTARDLRG